MKYLIGIIILFTSICTQANLLISPTRINFDDRDRIQEVTLINTTTKERVYRIQWSEKKAKFEGGYEELLENDNSVDRLSPYVRLSPRQVRLKPGEKQVIKLQLRKKADMLSDEYRSHLQFVAVPPESENVDSDDVEGMRMMINMYVSYSIPVLYHPEQPIASVKIDDYKILPREDEGANLQLLLSRSQNNSSYGRIEVYADINGKTTRVGLANNVAVFRELDSALVNVRIPKFKTYENLNQVTIRYIGEKEYYGQTLAERTVSI